jgi:hypothetical protein
MKSALKRHGFAWVTLGLFVFALTGHWWLAWLAYIDEQTMHAAPVLFSEYLVEVGRDTLENWQSEFLQLLWQVAGLAFLFYIGSPQSKEGDERKEEKIDRLLEELHPDGKKIIATLDKKYPRA